MRSPTVSASPTAGGLAGYLTHGTSDTAANVTVASQTVLTRSDRPGRRWRTAASTVPNTAAMTTA